MEKDYVVLVDVEPLEVYVTATSKEEAGEVALGIIQEDIDYFLRDSRLSVDTKNVEMLYNEFD